MPPNRYYEQVKTKKEVAEKKVKNIHEPQGTTRSTTCRDSKNSKRPNIYKYKMKKNIYKSISKWVNEVIEADKKLTKVGTH